MYPPAKLGLPENNLVKCDHYNVMLDFTCYTLPTEVIHAKVNANLLRRRALFEMYVKLLEPFKTVSKSYVLH